MMCGIEAVLSEIESQWENVAGSLITKTAASSPKGDVYAAGFWGVDADYTLLGPPCFAINTETHFAADKYAERWIPPEWKFDCIEKATEAMRGVYRQAAEALAEQDHDTWDKTIESHKQLIARMCLRITESARRQTGSFSNVPMHRDFVVGIFHETDGVDEYDRLAKLSIESSHISQLGLPFDKG